MERYKGFDQEGYLCKGIEDATASFRADNAIWFGLAIDINRALIDTAIAAADSVKTSSWAREAVVVRLLFRSCGTFEGVILLSERGMIAEGRTLVRSLIENAFCMAALHDHPDAFLKMIRDDSEESRRRQIRFILAERLATNDQTQEQLTELINSLEASEIMSPKKVAALGPFNWQYLMYQRLSDDSVHPSALSLHRHIEKFTDNSGWIYRWAPGSSDEIASTLHHAVISALGIGVGATQILVDAKHNEIFGVLSERMRMIPKARPI